MKDERGMMRLENITGYLSRNAERFPDRAAILHPVEISFRELDVEVDRYAAGLRARGVQKGTRAILLVSAGPEFFIICFALLRIGAVPVMIDPGMGVKAMVKALSGSEAEVFIGIPRALFLNYIYPDAFRNVKVWISTGRFKIPGIAKSSALRQKTDYPGPHCKVESDSIAGIFYTSGSTGPPKGVIYHAGTMDALVRLMEGHFKYTPEDIDLCTFPLLGLFVTCLGSTLVIADMNPIRPAGLDPKKIIDNLNRFKCTQMFGSPMILDRLVSYSENNEFRLASLKRIVSAGAPVPVQLARAFMGLCDNTATVHTPYGSTEALPVSDLIHTTDGIVRAGDDYSGGICVGYPLPGVEIRIIGINNDPVEKWTDEMVCHPGEVGEIVASGPHITTEYLAEEKVNRLAKIHGDDGEIWHRMGDVGRIDENGMLWFYGRKNHRLVCKNRTLFTIPTEAIFNMHPDVFRSALVGINVEDREYPEGVIWIEAGKHQDRKEIRRIEKELREIAIENGLSGDIRHFLFHRGFPVDPRHNAKIFREKLALEAERRLR